MCKIKYKNRIINEAKIQKDWKIKRLIQGNRNRCEAKKLIVLNYTERGKRQKIYYYISFKFLFYTLYIFYILLTHTHTHIHTHKHTNTQQGFPHKGDEGILLSVCVCPLL